MKKFRPRALALAVASTAMLGFASQASADPISTPMLTIDLSAIGGTGTYTGNFFSGTSSELLNTSGNTHSGDGWLRINSLNKDGDPVVFFGSASPGTAANLYVTFTLTDVLATGSMNAPNSTYNLTSLDFIVWADMGRDTTLTNAGVAGSPSVGTDAIVGGTTSDDIALAVGSLIKGTASLNNQGGASLNSINSFAVCDGMGTADLGGTAIAASACAGDTGSRFFIDPKPFYDLAFTEFNNTGQGYRVADNGDLAIANATGGIDFNRVPEPGMLSLLGLGLAGIGATIRRRKVA